MNQTKRIRDASSLLPSDSNLRSILRYAWPILVNNLATIGVTTADTIMAGRLGANDLAAVAVGASYAMVVYIAGLGLLMALSPLVAHAYGAGEDLRAGALLRQGIWLAAMFALLALLPFLGNAPVLERIGIEPRIRELAGGYLRMLALGLPALFAYLALRFSAEGLGRTRPIMYAALVTLVLNIFGNYVLMYGKFGAPAMGALGCGLASALSQWLVFLGMWFYLRRAAMFAPYRLLERFELPRRRELLEILRLGLPIAGSLLAEGALFSAAALLVGTLGARQMSGHAIAINFASIMFMVPLAVHSATTIHVGHRAGRGEWLAAAEAGWSGIRLCVALMAASAVVLTLWRYPIAALYSDDAEVVALAAQLLLLAAVFQIVDGAQVGAAGALRGFRDARIPMLINVISYWLIGFPCAWLAGIHFGHGPRGVWWGLIAGLAVCALLLLLRYRRVAAGVRATPEAQPDRGVSSSSYQASQEK
ncbi:MAG: MATE family efflux transporter [Steroidobacteraceae bacterium]